MTDAPLKRCSLCGSRTFERLCFDCKPKANAERHRKYDETRRDTESAKFYGSSFWHKLRDAQKRKYPYCQWVLSDGTICKAITELHADHIVPRKQGGADDLSNLQTLCHDHHTEKTAAENGLFMGTPEIIVVCGPPGSGKSTYVQTRLHSGDIIVDLDRIVYSIAALQQRKQPRHIMKLAWNLRDAALDHLSKARDIPRAFVIEGAPTRARRDTLRDTLNAQIVVLETPQKHCIANIRKSQDRSSVLNWDALVSDWWTKYERSSLDTVIPWQS